ncbi:MAG: PIN domain-containing protein [Gaiellaceae bacterium]
MLRRAGRHAPNRAGSVPIIDTLIAATALAHDLPLFTQDAEFAVFAEVDLRLLSSE